MFDKSIYPAPPIPPKCRIIKEGCYIIKDDLDQKDKQSNIILWIKKVFKRNK